MAERAKELADDVYQAVIMQAEGKVAEAEAALKAVLDEDPEQADALHLLGVIAFRRGDMDGAADLISRAIANNDADANYFTHLGQVRVMQERLEEAEDAFRKALTLAPDDAALHFQLAETLRPRRRNEEAEACYREALRLKPDDIGAGNGLGIVVDEQGRTEEAEEIFRHTLETMGESPMVYYNLGNVLRDQHRTDEAVAAFARAIELRPDYHWARVQMAFALLLKGDYEAGWREYEHRWQIPLFGERDRGFDKPLWDGGPLDGRRLLLHAEQGFGDTLQFARYAAMAQARGGEVIFECQAPLVRLMTTLPGPSAVVARGQALPAFDCHLPLLDMPHLLGTTLESVPADVPYLFAEPDRVAQWRERFAGHDGLKIGVAWQGTAEKRGNPGRACPLSAFRPLLDDPGIRLFALQKEIAAQDRPLPSGIVDLSAEMNDFADTAAMIGAMDLVVSIDTAVAHLAAALGHPTWLMVSTAGDWRWLLERTDSPWYPSMRIFRQSRPRRWDDVLARIAEETARISPA